MVDKVDIELTVEVQYIIALAFCLFDICILIRLVVGIQVNQCLVLVGLVFLYKLSYSSNVKYLSSVFFKQCEFRGFLIEFFSSVIIP